MIGTRAAVLIAFALFSLAPAVTEAQRRCVKGIPCGNSCIAANKVCRKGPPASPPASRPTPPAPAPRDSTRPPAPTDTTKQTPAPRTTTGPWVASRRGTTYYKASCSGGRKLAAQNRIYFKSEAEAIQAGYHRSRQSGC